MGLFNHFKKPTDREENAVSVPSRRSNDLIENTENLLTEVQVDLTQVDSVKLPIAQLATLGSGITSMLPALRTVSSTITTTDTGLYRCIFPKGIKGYLATAHNDGLNIGTILNDKGIAAQARWEKAGPQTMNISSVAPINPATLMMAGALMAIEKKLDDVIEMEKQILSFLEQDKEAKIEGDLKTLTTMIREYKFNWDNSTYIATHHQLAADIRRDAEANMIFYQKQVAEVLKANPALFMQQFINSRQTALIKKFQYYRLSLYLYGFASFIEVMLQGQYSEDYLDQVRQSIIDRSKQYQETYKVCQERLDKLTASSVEHHVLKSLGTAGKAVGNFIGNVPVLKNGQIEDWLVENSTNLKQVGENYGKDTLKLFAAVSDSGSDIFIDHLTHMNRLFNQTQEIYIGKDNIYLVREAVG